MVGSLSRVMLLLGGEMARFEGHTGGLLTLDSQNVSWAWKNAFRLSIRL